MEHSVENTLRQVLRPVTPRYEFVSTLRDKLEEDILLTPRRKVIPLSVVIEFFIQVIAVFVLVVLAVRALMVIITSWKFIRASSAH